MPKLARARAFSSIPKSRYFRLNLTLPEALDRFLEEVGIEAKAAGGYKLPKTLVLRALVRFMAELDVNIDGVRTEEELLDRLLSAARRRR